MAIKGMDLNGLGDVKFGDEIRLREFCLRPQSCLLNNGSYGNVPRKVLELQKRYLDETESHPDCWFRKTVYGKWEKSRRAIAEFVNADPEDIVLVTNATTGVNCVIKSIKWKSGDAILGTSLTYHSIKQLWKDVPEIVHCQVTALLMEVKLPIVSEDALVQQYDDFLTQHPNVRLVLIDHITSPSAILMPVERLAAVCRRHGTLVMVDGAHAPGQLALSLRDLDVDFYTGNFHKWVYTPRGCAFLWIRRDLHNLMSPPNTSASKGRSLSLQFFDQGTRDLVPFVCAEYALQFYRAIGGLDQIVGYISDLMTQGCELLVKELGLERMDIPRSMEAPNLRLLKMPGKSPECPKEQRVEFARELMLKVYEEHDVQVVFDWVDGEFYLRVSAQVFNTLDDFHKLIPVMKRFKEEGIPCDISGVYKNGRFF